MANSNFEQFLYTAAHFNNLLDEKTKSIQTEDISGQLTGFISNEIVLIKKDLGRSDLSAKGKELIDIYFQYYESEDKFVLNNRITSYNVCYTKLLRLYICGPFSSRFCGILSAQTTVYRVCFDQGFSAADRWSDKMDKAKQKEKQ